MKKTGPESSFGYRLADFDRCQSQRCSVSVGTERDEMSFTKTSTPRPCPLQPASGSFCHKIKKQGDMTGNQLWRGKARECTHARTHTHK